MKIFSRVFALVLVLAAALALLTAVSAQTTGQTEPVPQTIVSDYYRVDREQDFLSGITPGTSIQKLRNACAPEGLVVSAETVATGVTLTTADGADTLTAIVTGDLNGDGAVSITDMLVIKYALLGQQLAAPAAAAADLNFDGNLSITDFLKVKAYLLGMEPLTVPAGDGSLMLLQPGQTTQWQVTDAVSFSAEDNSCAMIDQSGMISALEQEGTGYVYALDAEGNVIAQQLVTVLDEPLAVSLDKTDVHLIAGQGGVLRTDLNHPVSAEVTWESSDPQVVTVENGVLTAQGMGTATITATLENGAKAEANVTVAPPITDISIERKLYKVKPGDTKQLQLFTTPDDSGEVIIWSSSDTTIATVDENGLVTGVDYGTVTITATGKYSGLTAQCEVKVCDVIQVAITFDDGPSVHTERLLDFLKENDIRVTFFLVGNRMKSFSSFVKREVEEGHEIGYHSFNHTIQTTLSSDKITSDFVWSDNTLYEMTGARFTVWRTPGGGFNARVLSAVKLPHIYWSLDTLDWKTRNADKVYYSIVNNSDDGDIVLLHDLHGTTVDGAIRALKVMLAGDYEFLTVTELLSRDGTPPENCKNYYNG